jgi:hypothetical protein
MPAPDQWINEYQEFKNSDWAPTRLSVGQEKEFRDWIGGTQWFNQIKEKVKKQQGAEPESQALLSQLIDHPEPVYDYRGAWLAGVGPQDYAHDPNSQHWQSSTPDGKPLKSPNHPTAWMEYFMRHHKTDPMELGLDTYEKAVDYSQKAPVAP